ncbi:carbohydrate ABC transporter permease [Microlunatus flavus]|uniref:Multiple sugar transport system permease protein n=1 Tax=Microlunatus flavus TaxID=1036181 RepID=A0A1H9ID73_9ACTN|nr:carbohydrate ABC transporter permease [Microlunatus flavus]SEQ72526.1 multiple sugar transport system permease protein [Microlunatus flavus]
MAVAPALPRAVDAPAPAPARRRAKHRWVFHAVMGPVAFLWVLPLLFVIVVALRSFDDIATNGLGSLPSSFTLEAFGTAWTGGSIGGALRNSLVVTAATVVLVLFLASLSAFALSRYKIPFGRAILLAMLAGNLLPPQILLIPVSKICEMLGIYDRLFALVAVQVGFGLGFFTFVLYGFMRSLPAEVFEAAKIDGAGELRTYAVMVLPLCRPALAALAALESTWVFNDLLWALTVLRTDTKFPITAALLNLQGGYTTSWNVVAAGSLIAAVPTTIVFFAFQRHFVSGLLVGASK